MNKLKRDFKDNIHVSINTYKNYYDIKESKRKFLKRFSFFRNLIK